MIQIDLAMNHLFLQVGQRDGIALEVSQQQVNGLKGFLVAER